jgi:hypothetical protein
VKLALTINDDNGDPMAEVITHVDDDGLIVVDAYSIVDIGLRVALNGTVVATQAKGVER